MLDMRLVRERPDIIENDLKRRNQPEKIKILKVLSREDRSYRILLKEAETLRHRRNLRTRELAQRKREGENIQKHAAEVRQLNSRLKTLEEGLGLSKAKLREMLFQLPNILHESVPSGEGEEHNRVEKEWGKLPSLPFEPRGHEEIGLSLDILDIQRAAKISGARFYFLKNEGVLLDYALQKLAMDFLLEKGFSLAEPPALMRREPYEGVADLGDFEDVMYRADELYLIATSEHPLVAQHAEETLEEGSLPLKLAGVSPCFRKEAGSHGKDTKGIFRVHQFNKVEQVVLCRPEESWKMHGELMNNTEALFQKLELPYRVVNVCTGDIGSIAAKKLDLEAWFPSQKRYRELGSCSNATDYQARRLRIKYGKKDSPSAGLVHTLNSTAIPTSRTIACILENFQQRDGSVLIPRVLRPYMGGKKKIERKE